MEHKVRKPRWPSQLKVNIETPAQKRKRIMANPMVIEEIKRAFIAGSQSQLTGDTLDDYLKSKGIK